MASFSRSRIGKLKDVVKESITQRGLRARTLFVRTFTTFKNASLPALRHLQAFYMITVLGAWIGKS